MPANSTRAEVDPEKMRRWLRQHGFRKHGSRKYEYLSPHCPFCGDGRDWRVMVNEITGYFHCWGCGTGRKNTFRWISEAEDISIAEAVALVGRDGAADIDAVFAEAVAEVHAEAPLLRSMVPDTTGVYWWSGEALPAPWCHDALAATVARGFSVEFLLGKRIGFGLHGRYVGRVVLPVFFGGVMVWLQAWDWTRTDSIKYHSPSTVPGIVGRRQVLFQWDHCQRANVIVLAEGIFNAWTAELAGYASIASFGKSLSPEQFALLLPFVRAPRRLIVAFDADARRQAVRLYYHVLRFGGAASIVKYVDDRDMNALGVQATAAMLASAGAPDWLDDAPDIL